MTDDQNEIAPAPIQVEMHRCARRKGSFKLEVHDWLGDIQQVHHNKKLVEVRFKSTRKDIFENSNDLTLEYGDIVAVEAQSGHDVGIVSLMGELVYEQIKKSKIVVPPEGFKKIYRKARQNDIDKWNEAKALEHSTMIKARRTTKRLNLNMKIGDVEYQGDRTKAIFYYIADERVDFRELIKVLAEEFKVRIEMRQIGARQEAGRIGGIGPCGKALCCSLYIARFASVSTQAARFQDLSLNPQKLAGQCGKLKCCLNYEVDCYIDAQKDFPRTSIPLTFGGGTIARHQKTDIFKRIMWYSFEKDSTNTFVALSVDKVKEVIALNRQGKEPDKLESDAIYIEADDEPDYENIVGQESLTRFDNKQRNKKKKPNGNRNPNQQNQNQRQPQQPNQQQPQRNNLNQQNQPNNNQTQQQRQPQQPGQQSQQQPRRDNPNQNQNRQNNPNQQRDGRDNRNRNNNRPNKPNNSGNENPPQ